jgi:hypothetical protein
MIMRNVRTSAKPARAILACVPEVSAEDLQVIAGEPSTGGDRCQPCKGFGLVRGIGRRQGAHYVSLSGAQAALQAGRAVDCPRCGGLGVVELVAGVA